MYVCVSVRGAFSILAGYGRDRTDARAAAATRVFSASLVPR